MNDAARKQEALSCTPTVTWSTTPQPQGPWADRHLLVLGLQLVGEGELRRLLLQLSELVLVLGHLLQRRLDELALHVADRHVELVDLQVPQDDLALQEEHLAFQVEPLVKVLLDDLLQLLVGGVVDVLLDAAPLGYDPLALSGFPLLLLLQLLGGLFTQQSTELLLPLGGHESPHLRHDDALLSGGPPAITLKLSLLETDTSYCYFNHPC